MKIRTKNVNYQVYALDVESYNDAESIEKGETAIWLGCLINENSTFKNPVSFFYNMSELFYKLDHLTARTHKGTTRAQNILIYVYNLAFEWSFILPYLLENGWKWEDNIEDDDEMVFNAVTTKTVSKVWEARLHFKGTHGEVVFRDMMAQFPGSLRVVAQSFGLATQKGEIDYTLDRRHGWKVTTEEKRYVYDDTHIIVEILQELINRKDRLFFSTLSAGSYSIQSMIKSTGWEKPLTEFRNRYPVITEDEFNFVKRSIAGGITYATPDYQFKEITGRVCHIDANQMHPSSAYLNEFPYGRGIYGEHKPKLKAHETACCHIRVDYTGVKVHSVIGLIGKDWGAGFELWVWDFEIETMKRAYIGLKIEYIDYYKYKTAPIPWRDAYATNWKKRQEAKKTGDNFTSMLCKLKNNSSYGKLLEKPHDRVFENTIDIHGHINSIERFKDIDHKDPKAWGSKFTYLPMGSCIPARSRCCLIEKALDIGWENVTYFDTDSIFFVATDEAMKNLMETTHFEQKLGDWKIEEYFTRSQFTAPKRYKGTREEDGVTYVKAAGFNMEKESDDWGAVDIIDANYEVKRRKRVKGGSIIVEEPKEIKVQPKYIDIYNQNVVK